MLFYIYISRVHLHVLCIVASHIAQTAGILRHPTPTPYAFATCSYTGCIRLYPIFVRYILFRTINNKPYNGLPCMSFVLSPKKISTNQM
jgi:hypothetical protein